MSLKRIVESFCQGVASDIKHEWDSHEDVIGNARLSINTKEYTDTFCRTEIVANGQKAWILEYGKGSLMDSTQSGLQSYLRSKFINPARKGLAVTGRPQGSYTDLDGKTFVSKGKLKGVNLENLQNNPKAKFFNKLPPLARSPKYIMRSALHDKGANRQMLIEDIRNHFKSVIRLKIKG